MKIKKDILDICSKNLLIDFSEQEKLMLEEELNIALELLSKIKNINLNSVESTDYCISSNHLFREDDNSYEEDEYIKKLKDFKDGLLKV